MVQTPRHPKYLLIPNDQKTFETFSGGYTAEEGRRLTKSLRGLGSQRCKNRCGVWNFPHPTAVRYRVFLVNQIENQKFN